MHFSTRVATLPFLPVLMYVCAPRASACGGLFYSNFPINQVTENVLFIQSEEAITTHIRLQYSGKTSDSAWILPVPLAPELAVSHNQIFRQLQWTNQPSFQLNSQEGAGCGFPPIFRGFDEITEATTDDIGSVEVIVRQEVGSYDTTVISSEDSQAIVNCLIGNGYQFDDLSPDLLIPYVDKGYYFLALRLTADREVGDLQPIAMTHLGEEPHIPIYLTAVSTAPDLGIIAWIFGEHRAIPRNYLCVQVNGALIDCFNGGFNYPEVVTEATNVAESQTFVTDYASSSNVVNNSFFGDFDLAALCQQQYSTDFLSTALRQSFSRDAQMQILIRRHIPIPEVVVTEGVLKVVFSGDHETYEEMWEAGLLQDLAERSFYNDLRAYDDYIEDLGFDSKAFANDLQRIVVEPSQDVW